MDLLEKYLFSTNKLPSDGLIRYYPLDGNANDLSGNNANGTLNGVTPTTNRKGVENKCYSFNGSSSIPIPNFSSLPIWTISMWVYQIDNNTWSAPCLFKEGNVICNGIAKLNGIYMIMKNNQTFVNGKGVNVQLNQWAHLVGNSTGQMYINKVAGGSSGTDTNWGVSASSIGVGYQMFSGKIDDVRIYNRILNQQEIIQLYNE